MSEPNAVVFTGTLQWPRGALGERALLAFEPYDVTKLALDEPAPVDVPGWLLERGFEQLVDGAWNSPYLEEHVLAVFADLDVIELIDPSADLFSCPLSGFQPSWYEHLMRERSCLVITGTDLRLATDGMAGIEQAVRRGDAFGGMVLINEALD